MTQSFRGPLGFIGVGAMGVPMITQIARAGIGVVAHDVDEARLASVAGLDGVAVAPAPDGLRGLDMAVCMLPSSNEVEQVVTPDGLLGLLAPGALIVDMGSSEPRRTVALAEVASAAGLEFVDAPVSGGVRRAVTGDLTVMFGGSAAQLARCRPVLDAVGSNVVEVGGVGAGHAMKALNNLLSAVGLAAATEVIETGRRFGLDPERMLDVLNTSSGRNNATEAKIARFVLSRSFDAGFATRLMVKDVGIAVDLARAEDVSAPLAEACLARWRRAAEVLSPDADHTEIARLTSGELDD